MKKNTFPWNPQNTVNVPIKSSTMTLAMRKLILLFAVLTTFSYQQAAAALSPMQQTQQDVLDLVPLDKVNRTVAQSGAWSNPATWSGGQLPQAGENIQVADGKSLLVDVASDVSLKTIRVDGVIQFDTTRNVRIKVDTLAVTETGTLQIGSENNPVPSDKTVDIIIANNGPVNRTWDKANMSRGILIQGKTRIYGDKKSAFHELSIKPDVGATQIQLDSVPTGWRQGDLIAVTATRFFKAIKGPFQVEDELRRIKSISGNTIVLGSVADANTAAPLTNNHVPDVAEMPVYAANLTRNITFSSEGGETLPAAQRGHFVVMHNPDSVIRGAGFYYLGRTDKSKPIDDFKLNRRGHRILVNGKPVPGSNNNPRARYAVHFHHTGLDINVPPVICSDNAVFTSPGWGFVNHESHVIMENNASYGVYGSHYVTEDGNEIGTFKNNIAIKAEGKRTGVAMGEFNHDVGSGGHGFWLESRNMEFEKNAVSGVRSDGIVYFQRNMITPPSMLQVPVENLITPDKEIVKNMPSIYYSDIPITDDKNNTIVASGGTLNIMKGGRQQAHDVRSVIQSLKGYSVSQGITLAYTSKYTFRDLRLFADATSNRWYSGASLTRITRDITIVDAEIDGFVHPVKTGTRLFGKSDETDASFVNVKIDGRPINLATDIQKDLNDVVYNYNPAFQFAVNLANTANSSTLTFTPSGTLDTIQPGVSYSLWINGTKTDSLGNVPFSSRWDQPSIANILRKGYFTRPDGKKAIIITDVYADRLNGQTRTVDTLVNFNPAYRAVGPNLGALAY